jgi:uncharacterized membrane protein
MKRKLAQHDKRSFEERQAAKKAAVLGKGKEKKNRLLLITVPLLVGLLLFAGLYAFNKMGGSSDPVARAGEIKHPLRLFGDGKARHFQFETEDGLTIKYFVLKSSDGVVRAAFDACDVCWKSGKGYTQAGDYMICRNCGRRFASVKINEVKGGCNPAPLRRSVVGDQLVIQVGDILTGRQYFDFLREG